MKIIVTGGAGYIGSHTLVDLINHDYEVVCIDNLSRSSHYSIDAVEQITGKKIKFYQTDLCSKQATAEVFAAHADAFGVIHFAALKSVPESVEQPLLYYDNNLLSLLNVLENVGKYKISNFVFSSSCSVYGNTTQLPVSENTPMQQAESPYAHTKQIGEEIIRSWVKTVETKTVLLRYFNPIGAHPSALIGEIPIDKPNNLVPYITQTAIGKLERLTVYGHDYPTRDGSCIRDYIHVCDIAHAHTLALHAKSDIACEVYNLGTGKGISVLEAIHAFESSTGQKLNYTLGNRRAGDVVEIYADNQKAKDVLGWICQYDINDAMLHAWQWELKMQEALIK